MYPIGSCIYLHVLSQLVVLSVEVMGPLEDAVLLGEVYHGGWSLRA